MATLLSIKQAAAYAGVSPRTMRRWVDDGRVVACRFGPRLLRIDPNDLTAMAMPVAHKEVAQ